MYKYKKNNTRYQSNPKANQPAMSENPPMGAKLEYGFLSFIMTTV